MATKNMRLAVIGLLWALCLVAPARADDAVTPIVDKSAYTLFNPVPDDQMRAFSPDRPTKSNSATTVDAGHFQYEADFLNSTYDRYNAAHVTTSSYVIADPVLKLGLTNHTDLEMAFAPFNAVIAHDRTADTRAASFGFGDIYAKVKFNLAGNDGGAYALAVVPYVKAPTASAQIGNRHWEGGAYAPLSIMLPAGWGMNLQTEYDILERSDLTHTYSNYANLVNLSHSLFADNLTGYVEFWSDVSNDAGGSVQYTGDLSLAWAVRDNLQLDAGVNIGLNRAAPDVQGYFGIAQRF